MPPLPSGTRLGPYEITAAIGSGGMGAVYSARDTRLNRDVALKLLPDDVAGDADRLARFRREAQALAALNHPNIAQIYGIEETSSAAPAPLDEARGAMSVSRMALVMELVPGRTLDEVIRDGPTPWREVVPIARQIAEALECAHESGIVHRDLKPSNIKIRDERFGAAGAGSVAAGTVKVLDFGLAKMGGAGGAPGLASDAAATVTSPAVTGMGVILGTAAYMAPEQARGRPVDKRADIWAYGVVLFELLTGRPLFAAGSVTDTIASVIKDDPDLGRLPADTPPALRRLIARCLVRDPAGRLRDIGEARILLSGPIDAAPLAAAASAPARRGRWMVAGAAALALAAASATAAWWLKPDAPPPPLRRLEIALPADVADYAISNDGTRLAYLAGNRLYVRRFDELDAADLGAMHVTARQLLWSPDDRTIAFTAEATLRSIPADGGPVFVIAKIPASGTALDLAWLPDGAIAFSVWRDSLYAVPATGGTPEVRVPIDAATEIDFHHLSALPDGRLIVAIHQRQDDRDVIELIEPTGATRRVRLTEDGSASAFEYLPAGSSGAGLLVFRRLATNPGIWALPFAEGPIDVNRAALLQAGATDFRVARDGTLVAMIPAPDRQALVWVDDRGVESAVPGGDAESPEGSVEISPDGRRAAYVVGRYLPAGAGTGSLTNATVLVRDLESGVTTRLNVADQDETMWGSIGQPTWFPDGLRLLHRMGRIEGTNLVERRADIAGAGRVVTSGQYGRVLADGRTLIVARDERGTLRLARTTIGDDGTAGVGTPLFTRNAPPDVGAFDVSADGRLIAYVVRQPNERSDIFLASLAAPDEQYLVQEGGNRPRFTRDGSSLLFVRGAGDASGQPRGEIVRVSVAAGPPIAIGPAVVVFRDGPGSARIGTFDTSPDGRRFLMWKPVPPRPGEGQRLVLVDHAAAGVR